MLDGEREPGDGTQSDGHPASQWETLIIDDADATLSLGAIGAPGDGVTSGVVVLDDTHAEQTQSTAAADLTVVMEQTVLESASGASANLGTSSFTRGTRFHEAVGRGLHVLDVLGRGGMGVAFRARQQELARDVAIKVLHGGGRQSAPTEALHREALLTADLDHPGVIPIHQAGLDFFCMRLVRGRTLRSLCGDGPLTGERLIRFVGHLARLAEAVAFAHHRGIIHRDIKPGNVMVGEHDEVLLLDWGLALRGDRVDGRWQSAELVSRAACAGTPQYLPPETACGRIDAIGPPADVFLLGALLYQALTGRPPYRGESVRQVLLSAAINDWTEVPRLVADVPPGLVAVQEAAMTAEPSARPDAAGFAAALRSWLHERQVSRRAQEALDAARVILAALPPPQAARDVTAVYADCDRARRQAQAAEALIGNADAVVRVLREIALAQGWQALEAGDLGLARVCADRVVVDDQDSRMGGGHDAVARDSAVAFGVAVAAAEVRRAQAHRRLRILAVAALLLVGLGLLSLIIGTRYALDGEARLMAQRQGRALDLLAQAQDLPAEDLAGRQVLLHQALGFDEQQPQIRSLLGETTLALAWQSLRGGDLASAEHLAATVKELDRGALGLLALADDLVAAIAAAVQARDAERLSELARRHAVLQTIATDQSLPIDESLIAQVAAWDGMEHLPAFAALLDHQRVVVRRFVVQVLARRKERWDDGQLLLQAGADEDAELRLTAWRTLGLHDHPLPAAVLATALAALDDDAPGLAGLPGLASRSHAALLGSRQRQALAAAGHAAQQAGDHHAAVCQLLWADEPAAVVELIETHLHQHPAALALAARLAWWRLHDPDRALALAAAVRDSAEPSWEGWHVAWTVAVARGAWQQLRELLPGAVAQLGDDRRLLAWRAALGDPVAEHGLGLALAVAETDFASAQPLALRVAQQRLERDALHRRVRMRQRLDSTAEDDWLALFNEVYALRWHQRWYSARRLAAVLVEYRPEDETALQLHHHLLDVTSSPAAELFQAHAAGLSHLIATGAQP